MLLLLGSGWKQKDKVPQVCMQILWCIAMHIINGFESLHEFTEAKKILFGSCQCDCYNGKSEGIAYLKMQGLPGTEISLFVVIHIMVFGHQLFGVRLWVLLCQDTSSSRTFLGLWRDCMGQLVGLRSEFDLVQTIVWCSLVRLSFTAPGLNCHVCVCEASVFVLSAPDSSCVLKSGWLCCWV